MLSPQDLTSKINRLKVASLKLEIASEHDLFFGGFTGTALRGTFGAALKAAPPHRDINLYQSVFESPIGPPDMNDTPPPGYIIQAFNQPLHVLAAGQELEFGIDFVGPACELIGPCLHALYHHGKTEGIGPVGYRDPFNIISASLQGPDGLFQRLDPSKASIKEQQIHNNLLWGLADLASSRSPNVEQLNQAELITHTPIDFRQAHSDRPRRQLKFVHIFHSLFWTANNYLRCHSDLQKKLDYLPWRERAEEVDTRLNLSPLDLHRRTRRLPEKLTKVRAQQGTMLISGQLTPFIPFLNLGSVIHAGKYRTMGLGCLTWRPL